MHDPISHTLIHPDSLGDTLDAVNAALFERRPLSTAERSEAAAWIADRQGLPGSYAGMFAPTGYDYAFGALTFTGESVHSGAATGHLLSEEACRALFLLTDPQPEDDAALTARQALKRARQGIFRRLEASEAAGKEAGVYCCGTCSAALWRHLQVSGAASDLARLENGLSVLRRQRDGAGRWKRFPFYYTLLALSEIGLPAVREELAYAAPVAERALRRLIKAEPEDLSRHERRRALLLQQALEKC